MKKINIWTLIFLFLFIAKVYAEISIKAEVDKTKLALGEKFSYEILISSTERQTPQAQLPKFDNFYVISQSQSSTISFNKGKPETDITYAFILSPREVGKFTIAPATIKIKNQTYSTDSLQIEVIEGKSKQPPKNLPKQAPSSSEKQKPESKNPKIIL
jgi:hypothetical protein